MEIGCGIGRMTEAFAEAFGSVTGTDIAAAMIEHAEKRLSHRANARFVLSDGKSIPLPDNSCDFVFSYHALQHIPTFDDLAANFREIKRVLRPEGCAKIQLRSGKGVRRFRWYYGIAVTSDQVESLAANAGLHLVSIEKERDKYVWARLEAQA